MALTLILLAAAGVVLWLRFFDHSPLHLTKVSMTSHATSGCAVDVTATITTNASAGTISYQWDFQPQAGAPQRLSQSVASGQHIVNVTIAVEGQGHGSATQIVTLDILGPQATSASAQVNLSC